MKETRITRREILQAMRKQGIGSFTNVAAVVLETKGELSVMREIEDEQYSTIEKI